MPETRQDGQALDLPPGMRATLLVCIIASTLAVVVTFYYPGALLLILLAATAPISFMRPRLLFYTLVALLPLPMFLATGLPIRDLGSAARIGLFLVLIVRMYSGGRIRILHWLTGGTITRLLLIYVVICIASVAINPITYESYRSLLRLLSYLALYYSSLALLQTEADVKTTAKVLMGSTLVICIVSFWQFISNDPGTVWHLLYDNDELAYVWVRRVTSLFKTENQFAAYLNWMIAFGIGFSFVRGDRSLRILSISASATGLVALILTQSRGALIGFVGIVVLSLVILPLSARVRTLWITICTAVALVIFGALTALPERFSTLDPEALTRLQIFAIAIDLIRRAPLIGIGYGSFPAYTEGLLPHMLDTHNLYLKLWAETGIIGMLAYLWMKFIVVRTGFAVRHTSPVMHAVAFAVLAGTTAEMIHGMVDVFLQVIPVSCVAWMLIAMLATPKASKETR